MLSNLTGSAVGCPSGEFECYDSGGTCVPGNFACDSVADCPMGEDERNCGMISPTTDYIVTNI